MGLTPLLPWDQGLGKNKTPGRVIMIPAAFDYHRPASLDDAVKLLAQYGDEARVVAGATASSR